MRQMNEITHIKRMVQLMLQITNAEQFRELIDKQGLTIAVFRADWCSDCHYIDPFMPEVEEKYREKLTLIEVDVEAVEEISQNLNILGIPSFVAFSAGQEIVRFVNKLRKTREEIEGFLDKAILVTETLKSQS